MISGCSPAIGECDSGGGAMSAAYSQSRRKGSPVGRLAEGRSEKARYRPQAERRAGIVTPQATATGASGAAPGA